VANVGVIGAGSWGTALSQVLALNGHNVDLWAFEEEVHRQIERDRENKLFLPGVALAGNIHAGCDLQWAAADKEIVVLVVPSHVYRGVLERLVPFIRPDSVILSAAKGIENDTLCLMSDLLKELLPSSFHGRLAFLSGPSFAREVARKLPTAVTVAAYDEKVACDVQRIFSNDFFRVYTSSDVTGVELGGALKNVIAIAAGVTEGLALGGNALAALITRGLAEISRFGMALGADRLTFSGLAGIGDLVLTCTGQLSRNRTVGFDLGKGRVLPDILGSMVMVAEGVRTAKSVYDMSRREGIELPICSQVYRILYCGKPPLQALQELMSRGLKPELGGYAGIPNTDCGAPADS